MPRELNLLSLDGGGVKGLSSLYILQKLMEEINYEDPPKPCDYFDMIGGTSTGGIIAIMLGRLEMTVDECINRYVELSDAVFVKKHKSFVDVKGHMQERYDSRVLENEIRKVVKAYTAAEDTLMKADEKQKCRVFVCATSEGTAEPELLTSYRRPQGDTALFRGTTIWEAARATSAASTFFAPIIIGPNKRKFLDGGTGANNPVRKLWTEARKTFCPTEPLEPNVNCLVSIGTGIPTIKSFGNGLLSMPKSILSIATETEASAKSFHDEYIILFKQGTCYRLNAPGVGDIDMDRAEKKTEISDKTMSYFNDPEKWEIVTSCAKRLGEREKTDISATTYDMCLALSKHPQWRIGSVPGLEANHPTIFEIISDYDPERILEKFSDSKCSDTTIWILSHPKFQDWSNATRPSCFWLHGIVGSGKTTITTTVVKALKSKTAGTAQTVSYFFFDAAVKRHLSAICALESFVKQLSGALGQRNAIPSTVHQAMMRYYCPRPRKPVQDSSSEIRLFQYGLSKRPTQEPLLQTPVRPSMQELMRDILLPMISCTPQSIFVVDGLDECLNEGHQRDDLMRAFTQIISRGGTVYISSREEVTVTNFISQAISLRVSKENKAINDDVLRVIDNHININMAAKPITKDPKTIAEIRKVLMAKADAMFLWVCLLIDVLWQDSKSDSDIMKHLRSLPKNLEETYQWCMKRLSVDQQKYGQIILRWVCAATTPFHVEHLREALATNLETGRLNIMAKYSEAFIMSCSGNLYYIDEDGFVLPAHHSVTQWVFPITIRTSPRSSMLTWDRTQVGMKLGELLVSHLFYQLNNKAMSAGESGSNPQKPLKTTFVAGMVPRFVSPWVAPVRDCGWDIPARYTNRNFDLKDTTLTLLYYAKNHWLEYTHAISHNSPQWERWRSLVINQYHGAIYPWRRVGQSTISHFSGLLGWTIMNNHSACLFLLTGSTLSKELSLNMKRIGFWDLPLSNYGNDPPLIAATKSGHAGMVIYLLSLCNLQNTDNHGNTVLHGLVAMHLEALCGEYVPFPLLLEVLKKAIVRMPSTSETLDSSSEELFCNMQNDQRHTALHLAARRSDQQGLGPLGAFLVNYTDTSLRDREGNSILHFAAAAGNIMAIKRLYRAAFKELPENSHGQSPLHVAVIERHLQTARVLVNYYGEESICCKDLQDCSSLNYAFENDDEQMLDCLIRLVVGSTAASNSIKSIVDGTIHTGKHDILTYMGLDFWNTLGHHTLVKILRLALETHDTDPLDIIDALIGLWQIQYQFPEEILDAMRRTVLGGSNFSIIFEALSSSTGSFNLRHAFQVSFSLLRPVQSQTFHAKERLSGLLFKTLAADGVDDSLREQLTGHLLEHGVDPNATLECPTTWPMHAGDLKVMKRLLFSGLSPLLLIKDEHSELTTLLLTFMGGASLTVATLLVDSLNYNSIEHLDSTNKNGETAFWLACHNRELHPLAERLLSIGAKPEIRDNHGRSPLWIAASLGYVHIVDMLLAHHGTNQHPDDRGYMPFAIASNNGHTEVAERLMEHYNLLA